MPSTTGGISPSQTTEISQSLYYEYHELSTVDDCANFYLRSFISCAHYCGFPACCSYPSRFSTEGGCCGGALGRRVASQAGRPSRGAFILFIIKLSHEYAKPSAFAMPISCYRSMAAMTLEGLDDEPHQERRSGAHASSLAFAFVLGIIAGQALPCGKLSFDGHDFSSSRAESVVNTDDSNCLAYSVVNSPNCCSVHPIHFGVTTLPRTLRFTVTSPGYGLVDQRARVTPECSRKARAHYRNSNPGFNVLDPNEGSCLPFDHRRYSAESNN